MIFISREHIDIEIDIKYTAFKIRNINRYNKIKLR